MGIDKIAKALKSCNKKMGKNLTISVVVGFLLSCAVAMGTETGTKIETKAKIKIEGKNNIVLKKASEKDVSISYDVFLEELKNFFGENLDETLEKEFNDNRAKLKINSSDSTDKKMVFEYNGTTVEIPFDKFINDFKNNFSGNIDLSSFYNTILSAITDFKNGNFSLETEINNIFVKIKEQYLQMV